MYAAVHEHYGRPNTLLLVHNWRGKLATLALPSAILQVVHEGDLVSLVLELGMAEPRKRRRGAQVSEAERVPHHVASLLRRALPAYQARSVGIGERQKVVRAAGDRS